VNRPDRIPLPRQAANHSDGCLLGLDQVSFVRPPGPESGTAAGLFGHPVVLAIAFSLPAVLISLIAVPAFGAWLAGIDAGAIFILACLSLSDRLNEGPAAWQRRLGRCLSWIAGLSGLAMLIGSAAGVLAAVGAV